MTTARDILNAAKRREATYRLCLRGDLLAEHQELEDALAEWTSKGGWTASSLADVDPLAEKAERIAALEAEMAEVSATLRLRALRGHDWEQLLEQHPAREGKDEAFNIATLAPVLVRACLVDPEFSPTEFDELWDEALNEGQRDELFGVAWSVNTEATTVPFSERASVVTRWRDETSKQPAPGASPAASS